VRGSIKHPWCLTAAAIKLMVNFIDVRSVEENQLHVNKQFLFF